eukprot:CAMPEP_0184865468 /NCGR_PEP_ID=MMETSP0580-20130426/18234_1 /TAXON_ID=1118495 /ORGANISM="Dactyliosolen fragilissimus" /LENGTH=508 /DNA_ID=CAMNT_0027364687 /DNA_START=95 /DNA_END=1622 /DNA_ORIENTATION=+
MGNRKVNRKLAPKHKSKAKYAIEKETNNFNIRIVTVTASQIRKATKDIKDKQFQNPRHLYRVPSHVERSKIYAETAKAISQKESEALPSHGGRKWKCDVIVSDLLGASSLIGHNKHKRDGTSTKRKSFPLFRWYRGKLELACLPHFFETIEVLDGGYTSVMKHWVAEYGTDWLFDNEDLDGMYYNKKQRVSEERQVDALSNFAWNDDKYSVPIIERKWMSPDLVPFRSRSAARKHAEELLRRDRLIDRVLYGFGTRMKPLKPQKPSKKQALDAGYFRFLRDGIWVIGQEESWLDQRLIDQDNSKKGKELEGTIGKCCVNIEFVSNDVKQGKSDSLPSIKSYQSQEKNISKPLNLKIHIDSSSTYSLCSDSHERDGIHKTFRIPTSHHWRLKPSQITDCYDAVMDHYNKVMYTVKARALFSELDDGFDVFRERGRGRFDMTLSAFDEAAFNFLNTMENTSWMPVVRKILGKDVNLVHKGAFLSMPEVKNKFIIKMEFISQINTIELVML